MDRATRQLQMWSELYGKLLAIGVPEEEVIAGLKLALDVIAETNPEFYEELVITARFENLLNGYDER